MIKIKSVEINIKENEKRIIKINGAPYGKSVQRCAIILDGTDIYLEETLLKYDTPLGKLMEKVRKLWR